MDEDQNQIQNPPTTNQLYGITHYLIN